MAPGTFTEHSSRHTLIPRLSLLPVCSASRAVYYSAGKSNDSSGTRIIDNTSAGCSLELWMVGKCRMWVQNSAYQPIH